jgi:hypothetical protein
MSFYKASSSEYTEFYQSYVVTGSNQIVAPVQFTITSPEDTVIDQSSDNGHESGSSIDSKGFRIHIRQTGLPEEKAVRIYTLLNVKVFKNQVISKHRV